jgi:S-formylglutathione hydrolase FrmB
MRKARWALLVLLALPLGRAQADGWRKEGYDLELVNKQLAGKVIDYTANTGRDCRMWSRCLWQRRDLYVYLPPHYDPHQRYPFMIWLHGFKEDEQAFVRYFVKIFDDAIADGRLPPFIIAAPDGSFRGEPDPCYAGSFFLNTQAGDFEDFVLQDVWDFICRHYPIRSEREAHIIAGWGMGGFAAFNYGIKHRQTFGTVIGISPPLNMRWMNCKGKYTACFDPHDWAWRMDLGKGCEVIGLFAQHQIVTLKHWYGPLFGLGQGAIAEIAQENPIEMIDRYQLCPGQLEMYVAYSGQDEYNITAQVDSFLYLAHWRGLHVGVGYERYGNHCWLTAKKLLPGALEWLAPRLAPFTPCGMDDCTCCITPTCAETPAPACPAPAACLAPAAPRRLFRPRRYKTHDEGTNGYPHTLPDPIP